jgi:hypothetical protein
LEKGVTEDVFTATVKHLTYHGFEKKLDKFAHKLVEKLKHIDMKLAAEKAKKAAKVIH